MQVDVIFFRKLWLFILCITVVIVPTTALADDGGWQASYWNNETLTGAPILQQFETDANHNPQLIREWDQERPWPQVEKDHFSARFERTLSLQPGRYRFAATADDGVRVWVNNERIIDEWLEQVGTTYIGYVDIEEAGDVPVTVEYYDNQHHARLNVTWTHITGTDAGLTGELYEPPITAWRGEYFNNRVVAGTPNLVRDDATIDFNWGLQSPAIEAIVSDGFSVRWTRTLALSPGLYEFTTVTDDGVRFFVNGRLLIDQWHTQANQPHTTTYNHAGGELQLKLEYYDDIGLAQAQLTWKQVGAYLTVSPSPAPPAWQGHYFNNSVLAGDPVLIRQDSAINFDWGFESPNDTYLTRSAFSVRWTATMQLPAGQYRFTTSSDDGVRLWVNDELIIDKWRNQRERAFSAEIELPEGQVPVKMEYYNAENEAVAKLSWERLDGPLPDNVLVAVTPFSGSGGGTTASAAPLQAIYNADSLLTVQTTTNIPLGPIYVRAEPNMLADKMGRLFDTEAVPVYGRNEYSTWVLVQMADGRFGWITRLYTDLPYNIIDLPDVSHAWQPPSAPALNEPVYVTRYSRLAVLRVEPNILSDQIVAMPANEAIEVLGRNRFSTWVRVRLDDEREGWVSILYISADFDIKHLPNLEL